VFPHDASSRMTLRDPSPSLIVRHFNFLWYLPTHSLYPCVISLLCDTLRTHLTTPL
jgi:hypothetical protein